VDLEADPVAETVAEVLAVPGRLDQIARGGVDLAARGPGLDGLKARQLRAQHELVDLARLLADPLAGRVGARAVRAVAVVDGPPVDRHEHVAGDLDVPRLGVGQRPVRPRGDDRAEARRFGSAPAHRRLELEGDLALGATHEPALEHLPERLVGELAGGRDPFDLPRLLDHAQPVEQAVRVDQLPALGEQLEQPFVALDGDLRGIEAEPPHLAGEQPRERVAQLARDRRALEVRGDLGSRLGDVAEVGQELRAAVAHGRLPPASRGGDDREPVAARVAGRVAQVHGGVEQQRIEPLGGDPRLQPGQPRAHRRSVRGRAHAAPSKRSRSIASASR